MPFDAIGLPGFQFIQDPLNYESKAHHSNLDRLRGSRARRPEAGVGDPRELRLPRRDARRDAAKAEAADGGREVRRVRVPGPWSLSRVPGPWSLVLGPLSLVRGPNNLALWNLGTLEPASPGSSHYSTAPTSEEGGVRLIGLLIAAMLVTPSSASPHDPPRTIRVADGIFLFVTPPYGDVGLDGNAVAIVSSDGVLVFDSNGTPAAAAAVLAEIRHLTNKPVRYLVNSHWHWDHWYGSEMYLRAYPDIRVITHAATRTMMTGPALEFNRPGLETQLPELHRVAGKESRGRRALDAAAGRPSQAESAARRRSVLPRSEETRAARLRQHDVHGWDDALHGRPDDPGPSYDRAVTPGDTFLYLPKEKVLITGDLLVNPISFALSCYPTGWLHTLEQMDALETSVIVPGHGEPLHDKTLLHATYRRHARAVAGGGRRQTPRPRSRPGEETRSCRSSTTRWSR